DDPRHDVVGLPLVGVLEEDVAPPDDAVARGGDLLEKERAEVLGDRAVAADLPGQGLAGGALPAVLGRAAEAGVRQLAQELAELDGSRVPIGGGNRPALLDRADLGTRIDGGSRGRAAQGAGRGRDENPDFRPAQPAEAFEQPERPGTEHLASLVSSFHRANQAPDRGDANWFLFFELTREPKRHGAEFRRSRRGAGDSFRKAAAIALLGGLLSLLSC